MVPARTTPEGSCPACGTCDGVAPPWLGGLCDDCHRRGRGRAILRACGACGGRLDDGSPLCGVCLEVATKGGA